MLAATMVGLMLLAAEPAPDQSSRLAVIQPAPDFTLSTQAGKPLRMADLKGKVVLVSFIFTTCSGTCPATTHRMSSVQQDLQKHGLLKDGRVQLLSITLDPARDTPETLRNYMKLYDADPASWSFLTGPADQVKKVIADWGMWARPAANGQLDHPSRIFLVDRQGRVREIYHLGFMKTPWVVEDIELLLGENPKSKIQNPKQGRNSKPEIRNRLSEKGSDPFSDQGHLPQTVENWRQKRGGLTPFRTASE